MASVRHFFVGVVGESFANADGTSRQTIIATKCRALQAMQLKHEKDNPHDSNAVMVCTKEGEQVGYLARDLAGEVVRRSKAGYRYGPTIASIQGGTPTKPSLGITLLMVVAEPGVTDEAVQEYVNTIEWRR